MGSTSHGVRARAALLRVDCSGARFLSLFWPSQRRDGARASSGIEHTPSAVDELSGFATSGHYFKQRTGLTISYFAHHSFSCTAWILFSSLSPVIHTHTHTHTYTRTRTRTRTHARTHTQRTRTHTHIHTHTHTHTYTRTHRSADTDILKKSLFLWQMS